MSRLDVLLAISLPEEPSYKPKCLPGNLEWVYEAITKHLDGEVGNWCRLTEGNCKRCPMNQTYLKTLVNQYK